MKKLVFKTYHFPDISETFITNQVVAAINMGFEVSILVTKKKDKTSSSQSELLEKYDLLSKTHEIKDQRPKNWVLVYLNAIQYILKGYPLKYLSAFNFIKYKKDGLSGRLFYDLVMIHPFLNTDIFHVQFGVYAEPLVRLKKHHLIKGKLITTFLGFDVHYHADNFDKIRKKYAGLFRQGDYFTTITAYIGEQLKALGCPNEKLAIIPLGIDVNYFTPVEPNSLKTEIKLISVGRLVKWKGHEYGIRAVAELIKKAYNVRYEIIGDGEEYDNLQRLIHHLRIEKNVNLSGPKNQQYIRNTMQQSDIFLMTSTHDEMGRRETQGVVTGEAQACGLPVCAFKSGGVPYTLVDGKTGFLSEENDFINMAENIEKLIKNPGLRKEMSAKARQFIVDQYSLESVANKMKTIYQNLLMKQSA